MTQDAHSLYPQPGPPVPGQDPEGPAETKGYRLNHTMASLSALGLRRTSRLTVPADPNRGSRKNGTLLPRRAWIQACYDPEQRPLSVSRHCSNDRFQI